MRVLLVLLLSTAGAGAQLADTAPQVQSACASAMAAPLPADMVGIPVPTSYPVCDSYTLYANKDYAAARACAIQERVLLLAQGPESAKSRRDINGNDSFLTGGEVVLAQLYANGEGVPQSGALAARFTCEAIDSGEIETTEELASDAKAILATLDRLKAVVPRSPKFTFCNLDDPMSSIPDTPSTRYCDDLVEQARAEIHAGGIQAGEDAARQDAQDADAAIKPVFAKFTSAQRAAYSRVAAADQHFIDVQATGDLLYMGGYGSGGLYRDELHADFENRVVAFASKLPSAPSQDELATADAALNSVYRELIAATTPGSDVVGRKLNADNIRTEQRAWLAYRDALAAFGNALAPQLPATAWTLQLTKDRTDDLKQVYDTEGKDLIQSAERERQRQSERDTREQEEAAQDLALVSQYFDHQTPAQAAAWKRVEDALSAFAAAHKNASPTDLEDYEQYERELYHELYAFQYNSQHGFGPADPVKEAASYAELDKRLNRAYQADLVSNCLFVENLSGSIMYRSPESLRAEQRAWLRLRDAWTDFLGTLFPALGKEQRATMFVASRAFELETRAQFCSRRP